MAHPPTYLNKVVVGSACGRLLLLNVNSEEVLYEFEGWGSGVRCVAASPALDVIGVGLADGRAILHNVRFDETLMAFDNASGVGAGTEGLLGGGAGGASHVGGGACTTLSFKCASLPAAGLHREADSVWNTPVYQLPVCALNRGLAMEHLLSVLTAQGKAI